MWDEGGGGVEMVQKCGCEVEPDSEGTGRVVVWCIFKYLEQKWTIQK